MISLFLGAGFSKWAFDLPLVNNLFDFNIEPTNESESRKLRLLQSDWEKWRISNPTDNPEAFIHWSLHKSSHRKSRVIWYVSRRLSEPFITKIYGSYSPYMFDERKIRENLKIVKVREFLLKLTSHDLAGILTCNYDTIVECALNTSGFNYGMLNERLEGRGKNPQFPWQGAHPILTGKIKLAKLHGSLSWDKDKIKHTSGKPGKAGNALIVAPAPEKIAPDILKEEWLLGAEILGSSDSLIVFGFAFNSYDIALLKFLEEHGSNIQKVLLIDPFPNIDAVGKVWPKANIEVFDPRNHFDIDDYLKNF